VLRDRPLLAHLIAAAVAIGLAFICSLIFKVVLPGSPSLQTIALGMIAAVTYRLISRWLAPIDGLYVD